MTDAKEEEKLTLLEDSFLKIFQRKCLHSLPLHIRMLLLWQKHVQNTDFYDYFRKRGIQK
jgi:hypothetical protein